MSNDHRLRHQHEDSRNEAALRVRALAGQEAHAREELHARLIGALVQRPEPHAFHECPVRPISERRAWGWPDPPGGTDSTGFTEEGGIV